MSRKGSDGRGTLTDPRIPRLWTGNGTNKRKTQGPGSWVLEGGKFSPVHINLTSCCPLLSSCPLGWEIPAAKLQMS